MAVDSKNEPEPELSMDECLAQVQRLRESLPGGGISAEEILRVIRQGRERYGHFVDGEVAKHPPNDAFDSLDTDSN